MFDIHTSVHRRKITVEELHQAWDIVAYENVLHVSEYTGKLIHRIQLPEESFSKWRVNSGRLTMSTNKKGHVIVCCYDLQKIVEYTSIGIEVRQINLSKEYGPDQRLRHAIQLDDDQFLICHTTVTHHQVSIFDSSGRLIHSVGWEPGCGKERMNLPCYLVLDQNGFIFVADMKNNRVIQLDSSLEFIKEFIPASVGLKEPRRMLLHEKTGRLYVSERYEQNIAMFAS